MILTDSSSPTLSQLVERYRRNRDDYRDPGYKEAQLRQEFLNPLFALFGWDVDNRSGYAEAYKEVIHEDSLKIAGGTKAPDYCFRIGSTRKFFVEAKKPSVNIHEDSDAAFQLRRYAWSSKLALSVLTNFETLAVYDCRFKPSRTDRASHGRILVFSFDKLEERWKELEGVFSKSAILHGDFDRFLEGRRRRGTAEVDEAFLEEIESWRQDLARNLALRNRTLDQSELNTAVQLTIDRIVFLRICEDRGIEPYGQLLRLTNITGVYRSLFEHFERADDRYNSGLFHFGAEKDRVEPPDTVTPSLRVDDGVLKDILRRLYYPDSPYEFSVLPASILGQVYERFLGSTIRLTTGHRAKIEPKPELRRAGGVYYTPSYIVEFIVERTVGRLLEGKTLKTVRRFKVVDPACGSGSFLIEAYECLLDWYLKRYVEGQPSRHKKAVARDELGNWRLTNHERRRILCTHIYGVDIDPQAIEVTKLSLLLKVLEGESERSIVEQFRLFHERALPDLALNIRCGDSLVGPDFYSRSQPSLINEPQNTTGVGVFDWETEFPAAFAGRRRGFDAVIGNPPYVYRNATQDLLRPYYLSTYTTAEGNFELYKFFLERSLTLASSGGCVGFIVSATFLVQPTFSKLRKLLAESTSLIELVPLGPKVFKDATVDTAILIARPVLPAVAHKIDVRVPREPSQLKASLRYNIRQERFKKNEGCRFDYKLSDEGARFVDRLFAEFPRIETGFEFGVGINTGYIKDALVADKRINNRYHRMVPGDGIARYGAVQTSGWIMYDCDFVRGQGKLGRSLPAEHLLSSEKILVVRTRNLSLARRVVATIDSSGGYNLNRLSNIVAREGYSLAGLLGILNSTLFNWLYSTRFFDYEIKPIYLRNSPMTDVNDKQLNELVAAMLAEQRQRRTDKDASAQQACDRRLAALDKALDAKVYELYGLSKREIEIVGGLVGPVGGSRPEATGSQAT